MSRYVDPMTIVNPNAEPLTKEETDFQMQDSFRTGRVFIKKHQDPVTNSVPDHYMILLDKVKAYIASLSKEEVPKDVQLSLQEITRHFQNGERPVQAYCWHLFDKPYMVKGTDGKMYPQYGWMKLRGQFATYGEMETEVRSIMQDHDSYTRTFGQQKGVFFPITNAPFVTDEALEKVYDEDVKRQEDIQKQMVQLQRKREQALIDMQQDTEPGSLFDYVRQKLKFCVADTMIQKGKTNIEKFTPILAKQSRLIEQMEKDHPNYHADGLKLYQEKMAEIGYPVPTSFYDGCVPMGMQ